jgi:hypothetical protein
MVIHEYNGPSLLALEPDVRYDKQRVMATRDNVPLAVIRSYDADLLTKALEPYDYHMGNSNAEWLATPGNVMYVSGDDIGLATFDYEGLYAVHWFFKSRGKTAMKVCIAMLTRLFDEQGAKAIRGVTPVNNKPARFLAKYVGMETLSIDVHPDGEEYELMLLSKDRFNHFKEKINGSST